MATFTTSTQVQGFSYPSNSYMDRSPVTGNLAVVVRLTSGELRIYSSTNNGTSWVDTTAGFNRTNLQEWSSLFIDTDGFIHLGYRVYESGLDKIYYRRAGLNDSGVLVWDSEVLVASATAGVSGAVYQGVDVVGLKIGDAYYVHLAVGTTSGANVGVTMFSLKITYEYSWFFFPYWAYTVKNTLISGTRSWFVVGSGRVTPALDFRHNGDAHTSAVPDLWVAFGRAQTCIARMSYGSGKWTGSTSIVLATPTTAMDANPGRFDGSRFLVPSLNGSKVDVYERDLSNTTTQLRQTPVHTTGVVKYVAIDYVPSTGDFRVFAVGTSTAVLYYVDYVRATNSWGAWTSTALTIINNNNFGTRRGAYGNARFDLYTQTGTSPYTLSGTHQILVFAPDTPVWLSPTTGSAQDIGQPLTLTWRFSDTNPTDTQFAHAVSRQIGAGAILYWNAGTSSWDVSEVQNSSATSSVTLPASWGADLDATHVYKVKVWDSTSLPSGYSAGLSITPSVPITPSISVPSLSATTLVNDTFTRVAADLIGTTPDSAPGIWAGTTGAFSIDGSKVVSLIDGTTLSSGVGILDSGNSQLNGQLIATNLNISTVASTSGTRYLMLRRRSIPGNNYFATYIHISNTGVPTLRFIKNVGGVVTDAWGGVVSLTGVVPSATVLNGPYTLSLIVVSNVVTAVLSSSTSSVTASRYLTNAEVSALTAAGIPYVELVNTSSSGTPALETNVSAFTYSSLAISVFNGPFITAQWASTGQAAFRITLNDVSSGASLQVYDSGWVNSAAQSYAIPFRLSDLTTYNITVQVRNSENLTGPTIERVFYVDYTEPPTPTYTIAPNSNMGCIYVIISNPKATGTQPELTYNDIYRRTIGDTTVGTKISSVNPSYLPINILKSDGIDRESVENTATGWGVNSPAASNVVRSSVMALDGNWSLEQTSINGTAMLGAYTSNAINAVSCLPSTAYRVSFWSKAATTPRFWTALIQQKKTNGSVNVGAAFLTSNVLNSTTQWVQNTYTFTTASDAEYIQMSVGWWGTGNTGPVIGEKHYFDRIEIVAVNDTAAPVIYSDSTARHDVNYEYRIQAIGTNGAAQYGAWVR